MAKDQNGQKKLPKSCQKVAKVVKNDNSHFSNSLERVGHNSCSYQEVPGSNPAADISFFLLVILDIIVFSDPL